MAVSPIGKLLTDSVRPVTRNKFIEAVVRNGHHKTYQFGSKLRLNDADIENVIHGHADTESQLQAIIDKAKSKHGIMRTVDELVAICRDVYILGGVKDELGIQDEITFEDEDDGNTLRSGVNQPTPKPFDEAEIQQMVEKEEDIELFGNVLRNHLRLTVVEFAEKMGLAKDELFQPDERGTHQHATIKAILQAVAEKRQSTLQQAVAELLFKFEDSCSTNQYEVFISDLRFVLSRPTANLSPEELRLFKTALAKGFVRIGRGRINVVGKDGVGKSCFVRTLLKILFEEQASTEGAAVTVAATLTGKQEEAFTLATTLVADWNELTEEKHMVTLNEAIANAAAEFGGSSDDENDSPQDETKTSKSLNDEDLDKQPELKQQVAMSSVVDEPSSSLDMLPESKIQIDGELKKEAKYTHQLIREAKAKRQKDKPPADNDLVLLYNISDHGGQEGYLTSHCALMDDYSMFSCGIYIIVFDQSKQLNAQAESFFRSHNFQETEKLQLHQLTLNKDFVACWLSQIGLSAKHVGSGNMFGENGMGFNVGVAPPPIIFVGTHDDDSDAEKYRTENTTVLNALIRSGIYQKHCVRIGGETIWFFRVENTNSGKPGQDPAKEVRKLIDCITKAYWSQPGCRQVQPLYYLVLEKMLIVYRQTVLKKRQAGGRICDMTVFNTLATELCNISREEMPTVLKYFSSLGVILYFLEAAKSRGTPFTTGLENKVFIDPQWISRLASRFSTCRMPDSKVLTEWDSVHDTGIMKWKLVKYYLEEDGEDKVSDEERKPLLSALCLLDVLCPKDRIGHLDMGTEMDFYVPGSLHKTCKPTDFTWRKWIQDSGLPPSLVLAPDDVQSFPETLFLRLVIRTLQKYPNYVPQLFRDRCLVHAVDDVDKNLFFDLELAYHEGRCVIVTISSDDIQSMLPRDVVQQHCSKIRQFVFDTLEDAKMRGMAEFQFTPLISVKQLRPSDLSQANLSQRDLTNLTNEHLTSIKEWTPSAKKSLYRGRASRGSRVPKSETDVFTLWFDLGTEPQQPVLDKDPEHREPDAKCFRTEHCEEPGVRSPTQGRASDKIDVIIVTAADTEFDAVKEVLKKAAGTDVTPHPIMDCGKPLMPCVAVSWKPIASSPVVRIGVTQQTQTGQTGTVNIGMALKQAVTSGAIEERGFAAMVGMCAGDPSKVNLGDVLVPSRISTKAGRQKIGGHFDIEATYADIEHEVQVAVQSALPRFQSGGSEYKWITDYIPDCIQNAPSPRFLLDAILNELYKADSELHAIKVHEFLLKSYSSWPEEFVTPKVIKEALLNLEKSKYAQAFDPQKRKFQITDSGKERVMDVTTDFGKFPRVDSATPKIFHDPVVMGDIVNTGMDEELWKEIRKDVAQRKAVGYEMEGFRFLDFVRTHCKSMGRLFIKVVSDNATDEYKMENKYYQMYASSVAAAFLLHILAVNPHLTGKT